MTFLTSDLLLLRVFDTWYFADSWFQITDTKGFVQHFQNMKKVTVHPPLPKGFSPQRSYVGFRIAGGSDSSHSQAPSDAPVFVRPFRIRAGGLPVGSRESEPTLPSNPCQRYPEGSQLRGVPPAPRESRQPLLIRLRSTCARSRSCPLRVGAAHDLSPSR